MKLLNFKKIISISTAYFMAFSFFNNLNCAKVNAAPTASEPHSKPIFSARTGAMFTLEDMKNLVTNIEHSPNTAISRTLNFINLIRIDRNVNNWFNSMRIYIETTQEIMDENLAENLTEENIEEICSTGTLVVGDTLNEIREVLVNRALSQETKKEKYLEIVMNFLNSKFRVINLAKERLHEKLEKIKTARTNLIKMLETSNRLNLDQKIADLENMIGSTNDYEIKTMIKITLNIFRAKKNLALTKFNKTLLKIEKIDVEKKIIELKNKVDKKEKINPAEKKEYLEALDKYEDLIKSQIQAEKSKKAASETLIEAISKLEIIERIPQKLIMEEIKALN